jgi:hypothetical protein
MAETAAHLVDNVLPRVAVRQWVLTLPFPLRYRMAFDASLTAAVAQELVRAVFSSLRRRARRAAKLRYPRCGAVTFIQRFGDALNLNVHFHTLALEAVYERSDGGGLSRRTELAPLEEQEVQRVARRIARRLPRVLERRGLGHDADPSTADSLVADQPLLASLSAASVQGRVVTGDRAGRPVQRLGDRIDADDPPTTTNPLCAQVGGVNLHAAVCVPAHDRDRLERLCRYTGRPPLATGRLSALPDGRLAYQLKRRWRDGTTHMLFEPLELIARLAPLVPPPRFHRLRYHGVLAPAAGWRREIVPGPAARTPSVACQAEACPGPRESKVPARKSARTDDASSEPRAASRAGPPEPQRDGPEQSAAVTSRYSWAELMRRVFEIDVLECPRCQSRISIIAQIHPPAATRAILECLHLPTRAPPIAPARFDDSPRIPGLAI